MTVRVCPSSPSSPDDNVFNDSAQDPEDSDNISKMNEVASGFGKLQTVTPLHKTSKSTLAEENSTTTTESDTSKHQSCENCNQRVISDGDGKSTMMRCSRCKVAKYCSRNCQKEHWKAGHRMNCQPPSSADEKKEEAILVEGTTLDLSNLSVESAIAGWDAAISSSTNEKSGNLTEPNAETDTFSKNLQARKTATSPVARIDAEMALLELQSRIMSLSPEEARVNLSRMSDYTPYVEEARKKSQKKKNLEKKDNSIRINSATSDRPSFVSSAQRSQEESYPKELWEIAAESVRRTEQRVEQEMRKNANKQAEITDSIESRSNVPVTYETASKTQSSGLVSAPLHQKDEAPQKPWRYMVEDLIHIRCYCITLVPFHGEGAPKARIPPRDRVFVRLQQTSLRKSKTKDSSGEQYSSFDGEFTIVEIFDCPGGQDRTRLLFLQLPKRIYGNSSTGNNNVVVSTDDYSISVRLSYGRAGYNLPFSLETDEVTSFEETIMTSLTELNSLQCRSCKLELIGESQESEASPEEAPNHIKKVLPLPRGYWDEISDYLTCFEGDSAVKLTSVPTSAVKPGLVLEDSNVLVLHRHNLGKSICALSIEGYGEAAQDASSAPSAILKNSGGGGVEKQVAPAGNSKDDDKAEKKESALFRGERNWRDAALEVDSTNSDTTPSNPTTICCSLCCSTLGFTSPGDEMSIRLYKHRLTTSDESNKTDAGSKQKTTIDRNTCASFAASQLVRYAESQAVFAFVVEQKKAKKGPHSSASGSPKSVASDDEKCLLIKLLSWDSYVATGDDEYSNLERVGDRLVVAQPKKAVKVVFEEAHKSAVEGVSGAGWFWDDVDLCCPPLAIRAKTKTAINHGTSAASSGEDTDAAKKSSVRMHLSEDEYRELHEALARGASHFSKAVSNATVSFRVGKSAIGRASLSMLPLLHC